MNGAPEAEPAIAVALVPRHYVVSLSLDQQAMFELCSSLRKLDDEYEVPAVVGALAAQLEEAFSGDLPQRVTLVEPDEEA